MGQGPDAESGESRICCKQPDGWVKDWGGPRMETVGGRGSSGEGVAGTKKTILPDRETRQRLAAALQHRLRGPRDPVCRFNRIKQPLFFRF
ncbi:hypothetical protein ROHU_024764 [Labeo rohita]|uniref:Uncharacterized protein n=1 Tax=Labeo rohita TaxID=84645 RepID=A0A498MMB0_LABRO|nr:hypothetical protein ROHU_007767 [Labeo rohita]RXN20672.1 hypothetical protein ROHU_024764 [Labeo rohita]